MHPAVPQPTDAEPVDDAIDRRRAYSRELLGLDSRTASRPLHTVRATPARTASPATATSSTSRAPRNGNPAVEPHEPNGWADDTDNEHFDVPGHPDAAHGGFLRGLVDLGQDEIFLGVGEPGQE